jgi:hypothetical protein
MRRRKFITFLGGAVAKDIGVEIVRSSEKPAANRKPIEERCPLLAQSNVATRYSHVRFAPGANEALGRLRTKICVLQAPRQIGFARRGLKYNFPLGERIDPIRDGQRLLD